MSRKRRSNNYPAGMLAGSCIIGMIIYFFLGLADYASKPPVHHAPYAVRHSSPDLKTPYTHDQDQAADMNLSWPNPDLLTEVTR